MTDNSGFSLSQILNPDTIKRYLQEQEQTVQQVQQTQAPLPPAIDVPVVEVPPPVTLHGRLKVRANFPYDSLLGLSYEQIKQRVYEAIEGRNQGEDWLPVVRLFDIELWQEVIKDEPAQRPGHLAAAADSVASRRVSEEGDFRLHGDGPDSLPRVAGHGEQEGSGAGSQRHGRGLDRGDELAGSSPVHGVTGDVADDSPEPRSGRPGRESSVE